MSYEVVVNVDFWLMLFLSGWHVTCYIDYN